MTGRPNTTGLPNDIGRRAAERAALNNGTLEQHLFQSDAGGVLGGPSLCMRCGELRDALTHIPKPPPSGRRTTLHRGRRGRGVSAAW